MAAKTRAAGEREKNSAFVWSIWEANRGHDKIAASIVDQNRGYVIYNRAATEQSIILSTLSLKNMENI